MPEIYIPDDWDEITWDCFLIEWPSSPLWRGILAGFVSTPARGRFWDARSGVIVDAQAIGREIIERNPIDMSCQDLVVELQNIVTQLGAIDIKIDNSVDVQQELVNETNVQTSAILQATLTSSATASAYANVTAIQQVIVDARPFGGSADPPTAAETEATGISDDPTSDDERCKATYWMTIGFQYFIRWLADNYIPFWFSTSNAALSAVSIALTAGARALPAISPVLLGGAALTTFVEYLVFLEKEAIADPILAEIDTYLDANFDEVRCQIYNDAAGFPRTDDLQQSLRSFLVTAGLSAATLPLWLAWYNLNTLALAILQSPLITFPDLPGGVNCDTQCGEV